LEVCVNTDSTAPAANPTTPTTEADTLRARAADLRRQGDALVAQSSAIEERFAGGQPIILGHHSTRGARHDRDRSDALMRKAATLYDHAAVLDASADTTERRAQAQAIRDAAPAITASDVAPGDIVWTLAGTRMIPHRVVRASAKTVTVETGYSWTDRIAYRDLVKVTTGGAS
jgi:hypothetical protein